MASFGYNLMQKLFYILAVNGFQAIGIILAILFSLSEFIQLLANIITNEQTTKKTFF